MHMDKYRTFQLLDPFKHLSQFGNIMPVKWSKILKADGFKQVFGEHFINEFIGDFLR